MNTQNLMLKYADDRSNYTKGQPGHMTLQLGRQLLKDFGLIVEVTHPGVSKTKVIRAMVLDFVASHQDVLESVTKPQTLDTTLDSTNDVETVAAE